MPNHPGRTPAWLRRAQAAATEWIARWRWDQQPGSGWLMTQEQIADVMRRAYLAGYEAGRDDRPAPEMH